MSAVIKKENINQIYEELNSLMKSKNRSESLVIFGSGAFISQGYSDDSRLTRDIDVVKPPLDNEMWVISADAGEKFGLSMGWLNSAGNIFSRNFPEGWEDRTKVVFEGSHLTVKALGRRDLICTKFNAICDRDLDTDRADLKSIKPTKKELKTARDWVVNLKPELKEIANEVLEFYTERDRGRGR